MASGTCGCSGGPRQKRPAESALSEPGLLAAQRTSGFGGGAVIAMRRDMTMGHPPQRMPHRAKRDTPRSKV
ncbi:hypothetical protein ACFPRL_23290 [Pseudoclavibacter helvolus]